MDISEWQQALWGRACQTHERSEEHTSELQSPCNLVCRLLLEKKNKHGELQGAFDLLLHGPYHVDGLMRLRWCGALPTRQRFGRPQAASPSASDYSTWRRRLSTP